MLLSISVGVTAVVLVLHPPFGLSPAPFSPYAALEMDSSKDIVCQLCGAWFETRKGLSSHARAHLRHFGVEYSESKGSPIDLLSQLIDTDDFKHKAGTLELDSLAEPKGLNSTVSSAKQSLLTLSSSPSLLYKVTAAGGGSTSKATSPLLGPPAKRPKASSMQVFRLSSGELMALPHSECSSGGSFTSVICGRFYNSFLPQVNLQRKSAASSAGNILRIGKGFPATPGPTCAKWASQNGLSTDPR